MESYEQLVKRFREKNSKPKTNWRYESWSGDTQPSEKKDPWYLWPYRQAQKWDKILGLEEGGRAGMKPGGLVEPGVTHYANKDIGVAGAILLWFLENLRIQHRYNWYKFQEKIPRGQRLATRCHIIG